MTSTHLVLPDPQPVWPELVNETTTGFHGQVAVDIAAGSWPSDPAVLDNIDSAVNYTSERFALKRWERSPEGAAFVDEILALVPRRRASIVIAPGLITVRVASGDESEPPVPVHPEDCECDECEEQRIDEMADLEDYDDELASGIVRGFSNRARGRMMRYVASVDWIEASEPGERLGMITLTYPSDWQTVAPDPEASISHLDALAKRFERATDTKLRCVWVREFQKRGAPHFHLLAFIPDRVRGQSFTSWISQAWYEIVDSGDDKHLLAGTGVDYEPGLRSIDPKRAAAYFAGYTTKDKDYQTEPPKDWGNENGSVGGFWGRRGLTKATAEVALTPQDVIEIRRHMRRMIRAQKRTTTRKIARQWEQRWIPSTTIGDRQRETAMISQDDYDRLDTETQDTYRRIAIPGSDGGKRDYGWLPDSIPMFGQDDYEQFGDDERQALTPVLVPGRHRSLNRRWKLRSLGATGPKAEAGRGFSVFVNNGPAVAVQLARLLHPSEERWPRGVRRPLP